MDTNDIKHSPLITVCVIIPLIYLIMLSATMFFFAAVMFFAAEKARRSLLTDRETSADDSDKEVTA